MSGRNRRGRGVSALQLEAVSGQSVCGSIDCRSPRHASFPLRSDGTGIAASIFAEYFHGRTE